MIGDANDRGAPRPGAAVETEGLTKRYGATLALDAVTLRIEAGEVFALLGPNGAGKTTWISAVCGLVKVSAGHVRVLGRDLPREAMQIRRHIGLVPQEINFDPFFTAREVLRFQLGYYGCPPDENRIDEVLGAMDLTSKADAATRELSGGMKRRLLIAKALVHRPRVVFLDEPTAGVDVSLRHDLWSYVRGLKREGTTIVLTTHYLEEAEALADRVAVIDHGRLVSLDTPERLMRAHGRAVMHIELQRPCSAEELAALALQGSDAKVADQGRRLSCPLPEGDAAGVLEALAVLGRRHGVASIRTEQPSLEQVFLALTSAGRRQAGRERP